MASDHSVSVARTVTFRAFLASDGKTPATGKTIAITISKNGATSFSNPNAGATNATEMASGFYKVAFDTTDLNTAGPFSWRGAEGTINDVGDNFDVIDANRGKHAALPAAAAEASGGLATLSAAQASNGTVPANVHRWLTATPNALISGRADVSIGNVQSGINGLERSGTAQSVGATSLVMDAGASYVDNVLIGNTAKITNGTHAGVTGIVTANVGATDTLTIGGGWSGGVTPTGTPTFELYSSAAGAAPADSSGVTTLLSRLSATRAGYLDNLSAGAVALEASLQALITTIGAAAAGVATAVWGAVTRTLTAGTNIVLAKGTGVTGFNDLSAAQVNAEADTALADYDGPTNAELTTALGTADDATLAAIAGLNNLSAAQVNAEVDTALSDYDGPTNAELAIALAAADDAVLAAVAALNNLSAATVLTQVNAALDSTVPDSVPADGTRPSMRQAAYIGTQFLLERSVSGTVMTVFKTDGTTPLMTVTLDDASNPTAVTRAT